MIDAELGKKLVCPSCAAKFYDLGKVPAECPKCGTVFTAEPILPSKEDRPPASETDDDAKAKDQPDTDTDDDADVIVSLDDLDEDDGDVDDDEMAAIKDVDLGDDDKDDEPSGDDDDSFLEVEDGDASNVADIVGTPAGNDDE